MKAKDEIIGVCKSCKEWTSLDNSCCGAPIWFEGGWISPEEEDDEDRNNSGDESKS